MELVLGVRVRPYKRSAMANRNRMPVLNARSGHPNGVGRPGPYGPVRPQMGGPPPVMPPMQGLLEQKMQSQHDELQSLLAANQRLAATHVALRQELAAAQQEMQRLNSVIAGDNFKTFSSCFLNQVRFL